MLKRIISVVAAGALATLMLTAATTAPAHAGTCTKVGPITKCGTIRHYTPDDGLDVAIRIRCDYSTDPNAPYENLFEGEVSTKYCKDTDQVYNRTGQEIWCKRQVTYGGGGGQITWVWTKTWDATGWYKINDIFDDGLGCTIRAD